MIKDIVKAIETEKSYIGHKLKGDNSIILVDEIIKCGFESLEEYFNSKREYLFKQLNFEVIEVPPSKCIEEGYRTLRENLTSVFFVETPETTVYVHTSKPYNEEYCKKNKLPVYHLPSGGGTIVSGKDDIVIAIVVPDNFGVDTTFILNNISRILSKYMDNVEIVDNDILVDNGKVCGATFLRGNGMIAFLAHFSFSENSELISSICHVDNKSVKSPSYMTKLDRNILRTEVMTWLTST